MLDCIAIDPSDEAERNIVHLLPHPCCTYDVSLPSSNRSHYRLFVFPASVSISAPSSWQVTNTKQQWRWQYLDRGMLPFTFCHRRHLCIHCWAYDNLDLLTQYSPSIYLLLFYASCVRKLSTPFLPSLLFSSADLRLSVFFQNFHPCQKSHISSAKPSSSLVLSPP